MSADPGGRRRNFIAPLGVPHNPHSAFRRFLSLLTCRFHLLSGTWVGTRYLRALSSVATAILALREQLALAM